MFYIGNKEDINSFPHLPGEVCQALEGFDGINHILIVEDGDTLEELRKYGLDPDCLYAGYNEIIESNDVNYYLSVFFQDMDYLAVIMPTQLAPPHFEETFYSCVSYEDITDFGVDYYNLEHDLVNSYSPEQLEIYVELSGLKESALSDIAEAIYKKAFKHAIAIIYDGRNDPNEDF